MIKKIDHTNAHHLCKTFSTSEKSICVIVESNKEARFLYNELGLYLDSNLIDYFPENEILPYDHFSSPESILKERFRILNSTNANKKILITTIKNLFEIYPPKGFFKSIGFITASALVHELLEARDEKRLLRLQKQLSKYSLLIIDELGYVPLSPTGAELLFEVFSQRYERGSTIVTSNLPFDEWTSTFGSERLTGALLDRLTHHVHILEMNGESFRLKHSRQSGKA